MADQNEPSMEDILASIRRILAEGETPPDTPAPKLAPEPLPPPEPEEEEIIPLTEAMVVDTKPAPELISMPIAASAACSLAQLAKMVAEDRRMGLGMGGLTVEELVRQLLRPFLKEWLDVNLSPIVERLVKKEIQRVVERAEL